MVARFSAISLRRSCSQTNFLFSLEYKSSLTPLALPLAPFHYFSCYIARLDSVISLLITIGLLSSFNVFAADTNQNLENETPSENLEPIPKEIITTLPSSNLDKQQVKPVDRYYIEFENDMLAKRDQDYTMGLSLTHEFTRSDSDPPWMMDTFHYVLEPIDKQILKLFGYKDLSDSNNIWWQLGSTAFTPCRDCIVYTEPQYGDRPYASLIYLSAAFTKEDNKTSELLFGSGGSWVQILPSQFRLPYTNNVVLKDYHRDGPTKLVMVAHRHFYMKPRGRENMILLPLSAKCPQVQMLHGVFQLATTQE